MANLFAWENWHLLWYLAIFLLLPPSRRWSKELSVSGTVLGLGDVLLAAAFWGANLSASIADATTLNRALFPLGPATCFFLALLVQRDILHLAGTPANAGASRTVQARANGTAP